MRDRRHHAEQLIEFLRALNRSRDIDSLAQVVLQHAVSVVPGAQRGSFLLLNRHTGCYEFRAAVGWDKDALRSLSIPGERTLQRAVYGDRPAIIREPYQQRRTHFPDELGAVLESLARLRVFLTLPIRYEGEVVAYLNLDNTEDPDAFCEKDFRILEPVKDEIAAAVAAASERERMVELEAVFHMLFERLADAVYVAEFEGMILEVNAAACEQSGYSREELLGMNIMRDLAYQESAASYEQAIELMHSGKTARFQEVKRRKDGTLYTTDCAVAVLEYKGRPVTLSVNRDMTERQEAKKLLERRNSELKALLDAASALTATLELDELLMRIYEQATALIQCDSFFVALYDSRQKQLRLELVMEHGVSLGKHVVTADSSRSLTARIAASGQPVLIADTAADGVPAGVRQIGERTRSWLGVPLVEKDKTIGVLSLQSLSPRAFSEDDVLLVSAFGSLAAAAITNAALHTGLASLQAKLVAVERATRDMKLAVNREELYTRLLDATQHIFGYDRCAILEAESGWLRVAMLRPFEPAAVRELPLDGPGLTVAAWNAGQPVYAGDVSADVRYVAGVAGTKSELAVPFWVSDLVGGVLDIQSRAENGIPSEDRNLLEIFASHTAVALAVLERVDAVRSLSDKLQGLHDAVAHMQRCTTVEELCEAVVRTASEVLGMSECNVGLVQGDRLVPVANSAGAGHLGSPRRLGEGVAGKTWETGRTLWGPLKEFPFATPVHPGLEAVISVPVGREGVFQAVADREHAFTAADVALAEILAGHLRGSLQRIRLAEDLREQATRDPLTGLHNRRFLKEILEREGERARRYEHPISVVMADIDQFKEVNDRFGHVRGDQVLCEVARLLRRSVRDGDYVVRYGGEEFVIVMPETADRAGEVIERLQEAVRDWTLEAGLQDLPFGLTMGSAVWDPQSERGGSWESLLERADQVLYSFKRRKAR